MAVPRTGVRLVAAVSCVGETRLPRDLALLPCACRKDAAAPDVFRPRGAASAAPTIVERPVDSLAKHTLRIAVANVGRALELPCPEIRVLVVEGVALVDRASFVEGVGGAGRHRYTLSLRPGL